MLTFEPHPKCYFKKEFFFFRLSPFRIKYLLLKEMGIDFMLNIKFNSNLVNLKPKEFIEDILVKNLNVSHVVTGFDFVFGNNQSGNVKTMNSYSKETDDFLFTEVPEFRIKKSEISSSQIRNYLRNGKLRESNKMLSRNWQIISRVISGKKQARQLGFRTANNLHRVDLKPGTKPLTLFISGPFGLRKGPRSEYGIDFKTKKN